LIGIVSLTATATGITIAISSEYGSGSLKPPCSAVLICTITIDRNTTELKYFKNFIYNLKVNRVFAPEN
jgi:hypothetical protein